MRGRIDPRDFQLSQPHRPLDKLISTRLRRLLSFHLLDLLEQHSSERSLARIWHLAGFVLLLLSHRFGGLFGPSAGGAKQFLQAFANFGPRALVETTLPSLSTRITRGIALTPYFTASGASQPWASGRR